MIRNTEDDHGLYLYKHNNTFAQDLTDGSFVVIVALENFFFQELPGGQMKGFVWPVEPTAIEPLLTCEFHLYNDFVNNKINNETKTKNAKTGAGKVHLWKDKSIS